MNSLNTALLVNLLGFAVGAALYGLLLVMVVRHRRSSRSGSIGVLLVATSFLGLIWNLGELFIFIKRDFAAAESSPLLAALAYSSLGFLPSVVVHFAQKDEEKPHWLTFTGYGLSGIAAAFHFYSAVIHGVAPSDTALRGLTLSSVALAIALLVFNFRQTIEKKTIWTCALLIFAASALHLSGETEGNSWTVELAAHQSSLPLALAILYKNYRFAFADLFLKRAISLILLALVAFGLYVFVAAPLLKYHESHDRNDVQAVSLILALWIGTALVYPLLHRLAVWLVDKAILHRPDYDEVKASIVAEIEKLETTDEVLDSISERLSAALTAGSASWHQTAGNSGLSVHPNLIAFEERVAVPTADLPQFEIVFGDFAGGRRLLSEESEMLGAVSLMAARRIDAIRVSHERCQQEFREEEFSKLAAEAQLTALRSQVNPHFLFNALTTIGYLIETSPEKAFQTLLHLTKLLRGVLSSTGEFSTLGDELKLIENYLDIERARFEEKLAVTIDVPGDLKSIRVPSLILQPLVENAIKHGISENKAGGKVRISARLSRPRGGELLTLDVFDTGAGSPLSSRREQGGVGLRNVRERLRSYYGDRADLKLTNDSLKGTTAEISFPVKTHSI
jgi:signal transduction histidine kinase